MYTMDSPQRVCESADINTLRAELQAYLKEEEKKHTKRAKNNGQKSCQRCGFCCLTQPCVPAPYEFGRIAEYLELTPQELASKYAVVNEQDGKLYLMWARETQEDVLGKMLPYYRTYDKGYCIFFDKKKHLCKIHEVVPKTARKTKCWKKKKEEVNVFWSLEQVKEVLPGFGLNQGSLYVVDKDGNVDLLYV